MCNYYKCNLKVFDMRFQSAEHAYHWRFMKYLGMDEHALEILDARTPNEAKEILSIVPQCQHRDWYSIKLNVMKEILHAKPECCSLFQSALINSMGKYIVELTQDLFWASELPPRYSSSTNYYPGHNKLGHTLESVRSELIKEEVLPLLPSDATNEHDLIPLLVALLIILYIPCPQLVHGHDLNFHYKTVILRIAIIHYPYHKFQKQKRRSQDL